MNEEHQFQIDFRTGRPTAIQGDTVSDEIRSACNALNQGRTRGLLEAAQRTPSRESISIDVWTTSFTNRAKGWDVPIIDLESLGLSHDRDGFLSSTDLETLTSGAEAQPYLDREEKVVYKLFDLRLNGSLGKKLVFNFGSEGFEVDYEDALWSDTLEKLSILNAGGGLPTEIVGLDSTGGYLIARQ